LTRTGQRDVAAYIAGERGGLAGRVPTDRKPVRRKGAVGGDPEGRGERSLRRGGKCGSRGGARARCLIAYRSMSGHGRGYE
jgi:hypothetical protein